MSNFYNFSSSEIHIFLILLDASGSMEDDEANVRKGLEMFKESFNDFYLSNSIVVSICRFDNDFYPGYFRPVKEMDTRYSTDGGTALNYCLIEAKKYLNSYIREVVERTGVQPQVTFVCMSDGSPCGDKASDSSGKNAIEEMNFAKITTAFAALGTQINAQFGVNHGFMANIDVTDRTALLNFLGVDLSNSCKEQSQSSKSLGASFFSQTAETSQSQEYSQATAQALEDNSWIGDI